MHQYFELSRGYGLQYTSILLPSEQIAQTVAIREDLLNTFPARGISRICKIKREPCLQTCSHLQGVFFSVLIEKFQRR